MWCLVILLLIGRCSASGLERLRLAEIERANLGPTMQPTHRPWSGWTWDRWQAVEQAPAEGRGGARGGGRRRLTLAEVRERAVGMRYDWRLRQDIPPQAFYAPNQIRHLIRWEAAIGVPTLPPTWVRDPGRPWRLNDITLKTPAEAALPSPPALPAPPAPPAWWEGAAKGLPLGAALLAAILLLVRAADKCLHTNLFKIPLRRRQSEEWPTPSVLATNLTVRMTGGAGDEPPAPVARGPDPPPPYSAAVAPKADPGPEEEPPPPYSACYVTYSNPPDQPPSVHLYTPRAASLQYGYEEGRCGLLDHVDTGQGPGDPIASMNTENDENLRVEASRLQQRIDGVDLRVYSPEGPEQRPCAPDHSQTLTNDLPIVLSVNASKDGVGDCEQNINTKLQTDVVIKSQPGQFLSV